MSSTTADRLSSAEAVAAIEHLSPADWVRVKRFAKVRVAGITGMTYEDLMQEAMASLISGDRVWHRGYPSVVVLWWAMRGIADNARQRNVKGPVDEKEFVTTLDERPVDKAVVSGHDGTTPELIVEAEQTLNVLFKDLETDEPAYLLLLVWLDGVRGKEAAAQLGWDDKMHDAVRKRLHRKIHAGFTAENT